MPVIDQTGREVSDRYAETESQEDGYRVYYHNEGGYSFIPLIITVCLFAAGIMGMVMLAASVGVR